MTGATIRPGVERSVGQQQPQTFRPPPFGGLFFLCCLILVAHNKAGVVEFFDGPGRREAVVRRSGHRLDQPCQRGTHHVVEIGIGEAAVQLTPQ